MKTDQLKRSIGTVADVLWERGRQSINDQGQTIWTHQGYTPNYQRVRIESNENLANRILPVELKGIDSGKLTGSLMN